MAGNVLIDDVETEEPPPPRFPVVGLLGLGAAVIVTLAILPGRADDEAASSSSSTVPRVEEEDRWRPVDLPGAEGLLDVTQLVDGSYLAVGEGPQAWRYDGEGNWVWVLDGDGSPGALLAVAPYSRGAASWWSVAGGVAVGHEELEASRTRAAIWTSDDSTTWRRVPFQIGAPSSLEGVMTVGRRLVAWGWRGSAPDSPAEGEVLVVESVDGQNWTELDTDPGIPSPSRVLAVANRADSWYLAGLSSGRPGLWRSGSDLEAWTSVDTSDLPPGWAIVDVGWRAVGRETDGDLIATLGDLGGDQVRRWAYDGEGWEPIDAGPEDLVLPVPSDGETMGVGSGSLWIRQDGGWETLDLEGQVSSAAGRVAVGAGPGRQPRAWVRDGEPEAEVRVPPAGGVRRWQVEQELGQGDLPGPWQAGDGWVVRGGQDEWWFIDQRGAEAFHPPWNTTFFTIAPVGDEWVALPSMHWSRDGSDWEHRADPWPGGRSPPEVYALTERRGRIVAVGRDVNQLWTVAVSEDRGHSWSIPGEPAAADRVWSVAGTRRGFVGVAGRSLEGQEVVVSEDGRNWSVLASGSVLIDTQPPAVLADDGRLLMFDTGEELRAPRSDITALARGDSGLLAVAGGSMWREEAGVWDEIPLDPTHGMTGTDVRPLPLGDQVLAVGVDRGRRLLYRWDP